MELFTSSGVTDAARADLKKEMTKKGVRKATMDSVLNQVLSASTSSPTSVASNELSQSDGKKEYVPPSLTLLGKTPHSNGSESISGPTVMARARTTSRGNIGPKVPSRPPSRVGMTSPTPTEVSGGGSGNITGGTNLADIRNVYVSVSPPTPPPYPSSFLGRWLRTVISTMSSPKWANNSRYHSCLCS